MKRLVLEREVVSNTETQGILRLGSETVYTIERPWVPEAPGGKPFESCVPAGIYELIPHRRPSGDDVVALVNPGLGVYYQEQDRPNNVGRYLVLIHAGNWVADVVGCIAPGFARTRSERGPMVTQSRAAMKDVMTYLSASLGEIEIIGENSYG